MTAVSTVASTPDPLIDEVRAIRADISARYGHDVRRLCDHLKEVEVAYAKTRAARRTSNNTGTGRPAA